MMLLNEYLDNPCSSLSIPYWKNKTATIPENMKIVHNDNFSTGLLILKEFIENAVLSEMISGTFCVRKSIKILL